MRFIRSSRILQYVHRHIWYAKNSINFALWIRIHTLPRLFIEWWQQHEMKRIVTCAYAHVPFYQALLIKRKKRPENIRTIDDLQQLPVISKQLLRALPIETITNQSLRAANLEWRETSGSTGEPFRFPSNRSYNFNMKFKSARPRAFYTLNKFLWRKGISLHYIWKNFKIAEIRAPYRPDTKCFLHIPTNYFRSNPSEVLKKLYSFSPHILRSRATILAEVARFASQLPANERPRFNFAVSSGENLSRSQRNFISETFECEVYNSYGLEEVGDIALECSVHDGLHVHEESFIVEILGEDNKPLPNEHRGNIIITYFTSDALPFIRYKTGDKGFIKAGQCSCGLETKRLVVHGREGGFLNVGGEKFHYGEFEMFLCDFSETILRFQLAKTDTNTVELRIIPTNNFSSEASGELLRKFNNKFGFQPILKIVHQIPYTRDGKTFYIIDESRIASFTH